ncbi:MAG: uroporphyrinogen-III synthase [Steroidobacteraceae bacterium]|jgi:uroporphyrinogen-III synthase
MKSKVVAILETRTGEHLAELIARRGAVPMRAPALEEVPDLDSNQLAAHLQGWAAHPFTMAIFQTGVGTRALFEAADQLSSTPALVRMLEQSVVVVRGPKPVGELNSRGVRIDIRAAVPFTTETVLAAVAEVPLQGGRVLVQRYGEANRRLSDALTGRGAAVEEIASYRWALPQDTGPLVRLIDALSSSRVDAVVFTSAVQVRNLYAVADRMNRGAALAALLNARVVASIGPVCTAALMAHGVHPTFEANPPKLGPLVQGLAEALK